MPSSVFIVSAVRTPIGIGKMDKGALFPVPPVELASLVIQAVLERAGISSELIDDVILGCVTPSVIRAQISPASPP